MIMKVVLKDKRRNTRVIFIDGRRYILPSNKDVIKDISKMAFNILSKYSFLEIRVCDELEKVEDNKKEPSHKSEILKEEPKEEPKVEESKEESKEEPKVEESKEELIPEKVDYSSMKKKELKVILEERGCDTSGMSKANMLDWLKENL